MMTVSATQPAPLNPRWCLAHDTIDRHDIDQLIDWLRTYPRLTKGTLTLEFEQQWDRWLGRTQSVHCNSGSSANLLMYYALLLSGQLRNKKVIVPSVGWVTSIAPAIQFGFEPVMCEADPDTFGLDLNHLEDLLRRHQAQTVMLVQVLGVPHKMAEIMALKERHGFILLEDACAAIGATYHGQKVGTFGDMASFSFYFGHQMSTIEGGMVSTDNPKLHDLLLMLRSHGWSKDLSPASHRQLVEHYQVDDFHSPFVFYEPGFNLRSTDLNAFIGLRQVEKLDRMTSQRQAHHERYIRALGNQFVIQRPPADSTAASISFGLLAADPAQRRAIVRALVANGIETRIFSAGNLGLHPFWINRYGAASFPVADRIHHCGFFLPNHPSMDESDVAHISRIVLEAA
jgi:CDP-6-deoxy-D-xylo-4-hexulose-3-dehydrase